MPIPRAHQPDAYYDPDPDLDDLSSGAADLLDDLYTLELWDDIDEWETEA